MYIGSVKENMSVGRDLPSLLRSRSLSNPDHEFLVWLPFEGEVRRWTYMEFANATAALACGLAHGLGLRADDRIVIFAENTPDWVMTWFAAMSIGAVVVAANARSTGAELRGIVERTQPKALVTQTQLIDTARHALRGMTSVRLLISAGERPADTEVTWLDDLASCGVVEDTIVADIRRPASILFTSGTTSRAKGVMWTHGNCLWGARASATSQGLTEEDRHYTFLPLFHTNAQVYSVLASLWAGATVVLAPRFSASRFWSHAIDERATWSSLTRFPIKVLLDQSRPTEHSFASWGMAYRSRHIERYFGLKTIGWWGMTETVSPAIVSVRSSATPDGSIGVAIEGYRTRIRTESGEILNGVGQGTLEVAGERGVSLFARYLDPVDEDLAWTEDGWFRTGDVIRRDEGGFLFFVERAKDALRVGGENVSAAEVEQVIAGVPGVDECAVIGETDDLLGEVPVAFVTLNSGVDEPVVVADVDARCQESLANFKRPRRLVIVEEMPRGTVDKVLKHELKAIVHRLGVSESFTTHEMGKPVKSPPGSEA